MRGNVESLLKEEDLENIPISIVINNRRKVEEEKLGEIKKYLGSLMEGREFTIFNVQNLEKE